MPDIGYGASIAIGDGATPTEAFVPVAQVTRITPPSDEFDVIDVTNMASADRTREFIQGMRDPGQCEFEINFDAGGTADTALQALRAVNTPTNFRITFPTSTTWTFAGFLQSYAAEIPFDDKQTATVAIKVTSSYTVA